MLLPLGAKSQAGATDRVIPEALELDTCVGLTDAELREYDERQERIRELHAELERH